MSGPRKCCPCPDCITFGDHFDKCDPSLEEGGDCWYYYPDCPREWILATGGSCPPTTTGYAPPWSIDPDTGECIATQEHRPAWIPQGEPHGWYWARSLVPQYVGDGSLYEISGNGEIWCRAGWDEKSNGAPEGRTVTAYTIGELPNSKYRLLLNLEIDGPNAGDCLILEFYNSNPIEATPYLRLISRVGGVETIVKTVVLGYTDASGGFRGGRIIIFKYMADYSVVCASMGTTDLLSPLSYLCATEQTFEEAGASVPDGVHAGLGNASGDSIPVALDDFVLYRLEYRTADPRGLAYPSVLSPPCFTCSCLCDFVYLSRTKSTSTSRATADRTRRRPIATRMGTRPRPRSSTRRSRCISGTIAETPGAAGSSISTASSVSFSCFVQGPRSAAAACSLTLSSTSPGTSSRIGTRTRRRTTIRSRVLAPGACRTTDRPGRWRLARRHRLCSPAADAGWAMEPSTWRPVQHHEHGIQRRLETVHRGEARRLLREDAKIASASASPGRTNEHSRAPASRRD